MQPSTITAILIFLTAAGPATSKDAAADSPSGDAVTVSWEHRHATFSYVGITTAYNCDALASQVGRILVYLGARKDPKVSAQGCPLERPSRNAWVVVDFEVPTPVGDGGAAVGLPARWDRVALNARRPAFMDSGDCELMEGLKDLIVGNFHLRRLDYATTCSPHEIGLGDFSVTADAPRVIAAK
jgi:hypothetical protein